MNVLAHAQSMEHAIADEIFMNSDPPILLVSPREPSGVSWLINGLLELGIRVDLQPTVDQIFGTGRQPASAMWLPEPDGRWRLHPRASALQKWLPFLTSNETFAFRPIPPVLHVQRLPLRQEPHGQVILFVRDLRDALHSLYRRTQPQLTWQEFVNWPNPDTLLDAIDYWRLFMQCWLGQPQVFVGRFEDYKSNAENLLTQILRYMEMEFTAEEIMVATERSSYAAAVAAERRYRELHPQDQQIVNRAGLVGEWESLPDLQATVIEIERRAGHLLTRLGYRVTHAGIAADSWEALAISRELSSFAQFDIAPEMVNSARSEPPGPMLDRLQQFCDGVTAERLAGARLETDELRTLLRSLEEFSTRHAPALTASLQTVSQSFSDGSAFHLARIRALLLSRRSATTE